jgi:hypothetical protein
VAKYNHTLLNNLFTQDRKEIHTMHIQDSKRGVKRYTVGHKIRRYCNVVASSCQAQGENRKGEKVVSLFMEQE